MTDLDDRLHNLRKRFERLASGDLQDAETTAEDLIHNFGLSPSEAKAWLKKEPNFPSDASYHEPRNRRKVTRALRGVLLPLRLIKLFQVAVTFRFLNFSMKKSVDECEACLGYKRIEGKTTVYAS
jgi:hypothetical protein